MKSGKGCQDCKCYHYEAAYYMVTDKVWQASGVINGLLCLYCLTKRIGRKLVRDDFTSAPCNKYLFSIMDCVA